MSGQSTGCPVFSAGSQASASETVFGRISHHYDLGARRSIGGVCEGLRCRQRGRSTSKVALAFARYLTL